MQNFVVPILVLLLVGMGPVSASENVTIVYSGNLRGELEPCGCTSEGDLGGIRRHASAVDRLRKERPNLFLVSSGGLLSGKT